MGPLLAGAELLHDFPGDFTNQGFDVDGERHCFTHPFLVLLAGTMMILLRSAAFQRISGKNCGTIPQDLAPKHPLASTACTCDNEDRRLRMRSLRLCPL